MDELCKEMKEMHIPSSIHFGDDDDCFPSK